MFRHLKKILYSSTFGKPKGVDILKKVLQNIWARVEPPTPFRGMPVFRPLFLKNGFPKAHYSHKDKENMTWIESLLFLDIMTHMSNLQTRAGKNFCQHAFD